MGRRFGLNCLGTCRLNQYKLAEESAGREFAAGALHQARRRESCTSDSTSMRVEIDVEPPFVTR